MSAVMFVGAWDPNQPRDEDGKWTSVESFAARFDAEKTTLNAGPLATRAYRVGPLVDRGRGIFYGGDAESIAAYARIHEGHTTQEYPLAAKNVAVSPNVFVLHKELFKGKSFQDAVWEEDKKSGFKSSTDAAFRVEAKIAKKLVSLGHDAVIYTRPPLPAKSEIAMLPIKSRQLMAEFGALSFIGAEWDESKHPRVPAGSEDGGQFTSAGRDFTDSELRQQVETASARTEAFGFHPEHVADLSKMKPADRVAFIKAYGEMAANPTLFYSNLRFSGARMRAYDAFFAEMKNDPTRLLERGLAEGFYSRTKEGEFTYAIGNSRPFRDALGGLDAGGRDEFEREFVAAFKNGGKGFEVDDTAALHQAGWTSAELERFADRVQAAGGSYTKWSKETDYAAIHNLAGRLAFYSQDYENFRGHVFSGWALTGGSDTAVTLRRVAEEAFPSPSGEFYRIKPNRGNPIVEALYSPRAVENIRALKAETEAFYRAKFKGKDPAGKPLEVYRGIGGHVEAYTPGSVESWTRDIRTVDRFGKMMSNQAGEHSALRTTVNYNDVLWSYESAAGKHGWPPEKDLKGKKEFVVIGQRVGFVEREKR